MNKPSINFLLAHLPVISSPLVPFSQALLAGKQRAVACAPRSAAASLSVKHGPVRGLSHVPPCNRLSTCRLRPTVPFGASRALVDSVVPGKNGQYCSVGEIGRQRTSASALSARAFSPSASCFCSAARARDSSTSSSLDRTTHSKCRSRSSYCRRRSFSFSRTLRRIEID